MYGRKFIRVRKQKRNKHCLGFILWWKCLAVHTMTLTIKQSMLMHSMTANFNNEITHSKNVFLFCNFRLKSRLPSPEVDTLPRQRQIYEEVIFLFSTHF